MLPTGLGLLPSQPTTTNYINEKKQWQQAMGADSIRYKGVGGGIKVSEGFKNNQIDQY